ncbi:hypothetical protein OAL71_03125 [Phycisphaerales bacterium]|nr:hypothetical protein [Phycisphaerales bacterium]
MSAPAILLTSFVLSVMGSSPSATEPPPAVTEDAAAAMESVRAQYHAAPGMTTLTNARWTDSAGGVVRMERARVILSPTGDLKVITSTAGWTLIGEDVYAESPYFPGRIIKERTSGTSSSKLEVLDRIWPFSKMPIEVRLRLARDADEAFAPFFSLIGPGGVVETSTQVWSDGGPCVVIEFHSADRATALAVWIDVPTGLLRGVKGSYGDGESRRHVEVVSESTLTSRPPKVLVATVGRREFPSYTSLAAEWAEVYAVPNLAGEASDAGDAASTPSN